MVVCRQNDEEAMQACKVMNDENTALCTKLERDFLKTLMGGCSTPISALAEMNDEMLTFRGNIFSIDGKHVAAVEKSIALNTNFSSNNFGVDCANWVLQNGGAEIVQTIRNAANQ